MKRRSPATPKKRRSAPSAAASTPRLKMILAEKEIRQRIREMAKQINRDYQGKTLHAVGILDDCFMFMSDLVRALTIPVVCTFVRTVMRDSESGRVAMREIMYIPPVDAAGKDILLVHGILQSGVTLDHLCRTLYAQHPASVRTATLLDKPEDRKVDVPVNYVGFKVAGKYVVGFGLGYHDQYRNFPYVARRG